MHTMSFIIPVYNGKTYLPGCVESIEQTGFTDYEILLIDDGSTDGSGALCDEIAAARPRVHVYHQSNAGVSAARNVGLAKARGEYVIFLDADDSFDPLLMGDAIRALEDEPADLLIYGLSFDYYHRGAMYRRDVLRPPFAGLVEKSTWMRHLDSLYGANALSPIWNKIYRRQFLLDHQLTLREDMFLYEDLEYSLRCLQHCHRILFYPEPIYHYRQAEDEGNAGRRLKRISNLADFIGQIEIALYGLTEAQPEEAEAAEGTAATGEATADGVLAKEQARGILLSLYLVLAREKINVSTSAEIGQICEDFSTWFEGRGLEGSGGQEDFLQLLLKGRVGALVRKKRGTYLRHKLAVAVKALRARRKGSARKTGVKTGEETWR